MKNEPKFLKIMRISTFLLFLCIFSSFAANTNSQNAKVYIRGNNLTINDFIDQVEKQTDYLFVYSKNEVNPNATVSVKSGNKSVAAYLEEAFGNSNVKYSFGNDYIVLTTRKEAPAIVQQGRNVTCVVEDAAGPVTGANVMIKGTTNGTITDMDGKAVLQNVPRNAVLVISFVGYITQEVSVGNQATVRVNLKEDAKALDEVVVVGYGTMRKSDVTGSISVTKGDDMLKTQSFSALDNLRGKASGVNIFSNSGQPGNQASRVIIRGVSTINASSNPLYIVDGVAMEDFYLVNPNDIEKMEVLKDASAAAIYGARGANGVIMVTTKRGLKGEGTQISYQGSVSVSSMARKMKTLTAQQWCDAFMQGLENENKWQGKNWSLNRSDWFNDSRYFDSNGNPMYDTNWQDEATRNAISHNHQLNIQQGGKNSSVGAFLNYTDQEGIMLNTYSKRLNAKMTYDANPTKWLSTSVNMMINHTWGNSTTETGGAQDARRTMIEFVPWMPVYDSNGKYTNYASSTLGSSLGFESMANPVDILNNQKRLKYTTKLFGNAALTFHLLPGLDLKTQFGMDAEKYEWKYYSSTHLVTLSYPNGKAENDHSNTTYWQEETYLTYNWNKGPHRLNAMAGLSWQEHVYDYYGMNNSGYTDDFFQDYNMGAGTSMDGMSSSYNRWAMNSYFLRGAYTYNDRYSATVTARIDGSSKFGKDNKYAFFPSAGLAWNVSNEDFMKDIETVSNLKLHTSYGLTGNSEIDPYTSLGRVSSGTLLQNGGYTPYTYISNLGNSSLKWEKTAQWDFGFNLGLFKNRLNFDISYYYKKTTDLLLGRPVPYLTGFTSVMDNIGSVQNKGVDIMVTATPVQSKDFSWNATLNMNYNKNKVLKLGENDEDILNNGFLNGYSILRVGESMGSFYGYERYGVWTTEDYQAGKCELKQVGRAHRSDDRKILGKGLPDWTGSFINDFRYKGFDLTVDMQFVWGVDCAQEFFHSTYDRFGITSGLAAIYTDAYNGSNPNTMQQAVYLCNSNHAGQDTKFDSQWVCDASYLRCNLIQLGYTLPAKVIKPIGLSNLRVYGSVNNAFMVCSSDFLGFDPEGTSQGTSQFGQNMFFFQYPRPRTFTFGLSATF